MERRTRKTEWGKYILFIMLCLVCMLGIGCRVQASLLDNPYVTFSPDGNAFTTNADEHDTVWYEKGYKIDTGNVSLLGMPDVGEHIYPVIRTGEVRVGKWIVEHAEARCIHNRIADISSYHGVEFSKEICYEKYYSGWMSYCADCGQKVVNGFFYMSDETAKSIHKLDMSLAYYYRCPHCTHLEQGFELKQHVCKAISPNQYVVRYHANFGRGYMPKSVHMYDNATEYEGKEITPQKTLTLNSYTRTGYEFIGWNTEIDGSGEAFEDGAEILNLSSEEQGCIILYAQWKKSQSVLYIDPNGGLYNDSGEIHRITGDYGSVYELKADDVTPPAGAVAYFETNGGEKVADIIGRMKFTEWSFRQPMNGYIQENTYTFAGRDGTEDYALAVYDCLPVVLPDCRREGYSFGGWYFDEEMTRIAGAAATEIKIREDITLYACWVDLQLESKENYTANGGKGAVDLAWRQNDNAEKTYLLYQKREGSEWEKIHTADDVSAEKYVKKECGYTGTEESYLIPYTGYYRLTLCGAQGENYGAFHGGKGGMVTAEVYLERGQLLHYVVGGQDGFPGGGEGTDYGNGGGYTSVSTQENGVLLIAGGGGGATALDDGGAGGSVSQNVEGQQGQTGMAGGGGGYQGGTAGSAIVHMHGEACMHEHVGDPEEYGGCYTVKVVCKNTTFTKSVYKEIFYYGNKDDAGNLIFCVRCGSYTCPGHRDTFYRYKCKVCGKTYKDNKPSYCKASKYMLGCDVEEGYVCGYGDGEILEMSPASGGSNYVKAEDCLIYEEASDINEGDGVLIIEAVHIGYIEENYLRGVYAVDTAAPDKIEMDTVQIKPVDENKVNVVFDRPQDNGTVYYHMAESYDRRSNQKISTSNLTIDTLTSGVCGYYYRLDEAEDTIVGSEDNRCTDAGEQPYISVSLKDHIKYIHIAAVDKAGNISETIHIPLSFNEMIHWPVITEQIGIRQEENIYRSGEDYYVKADGITPFKVSFNSRLCGTAQSEYQINQLAFEVQSVTSMQDAGRLKFILPVEKSVAAGTNVYRGESVLKQYEAEFCLTDASFTEARRSNYCKEASILQAFCISDELDGNRIRLTPQAAVCMNEIYVTSDKTADLDNSIFLIADGKGPVITGLDIPEELIGAEDGEWKYLLQVEAQDMGSGVKTLSLEIRNVDNGGYERIEDNDGDGKIIIEMSSDISLFRGEFTIVATACDHVENETSEVYGLDGITVQAYVKKTADTQEAAFKCGEYGKLYLQTTGYIERVEVVFPEEWNSRNPLLNHTYVYEQPDFMQTEELEFVVPFQVPNEEYTIIVKAYKGDDMVQAEPELVTITVSGSVLDEIRTRLR